MMTYTNSSQTSETITDPNIRRLMSLVAAEDAANGEVGCGRDWGDKLSLYLLSCDINLSDEGLRNLLREHLGHVLMERDFDAIVSQVCRFIESVIVEAYSQPEPRETRLTSSDQVVEHLPTEALKKLLHSELGDRCHQASLQQIIHFMHQVIHQAVLRPRHTWPQPIWVLSSGNQLYVAQASDLEGAIAKIKAQHPQASGKFEVVTVGGVLAPDQVIVLEHF